MADFEVAQSVGGVRWKPRIDSPQQERQALAIMQQHGLGDVLARVLAGRGVVAETVHDYLNPTLKHSLPDPLHLLDMDKACARIMKAIAAHETIAVFGDYDVDGATSSALLKRYFSALGVEILIYIPDRMKEGYGPNIAAFDLLKQQGVSLIITVDCGTVSLEPIAHIAAQGVDVLVIDHHMALPQLPDAVAVVNPNRIDQDSGCGNLAAVGVTFMVLIALNRALREAGYFNEHPEPNLMQWLDMVALGTICDVVPLYGVNRALVSQGLKIMSRRANAGIAAIYDVAHLDEFPTTYHAGFVLGPRINAGGRVGEAALGSQLLSQDDPFLCRQMAEKLDQYNAERQAIEASVLDAAMQQAEKQSNQPFILVSSHGWHEGVIGIVAGRIKEQFHRPAAVVAFKDGIGKGSSRSVSGVDLGSAIAAAKMDGLLLAGGGHSMAAGFSLTEDKLSAFDAFMQQRVSSGVSAYEAGRAFIYDGLVSTQGLQIELLNQLDQAGPYGMGNPTPKLIVPDAYIVKCERMKDKHLRVIFSDASSKRSITGVTFNSVGTPLGNLLESAAGRNIHLAGTAKRNLWNGSESVQFMIEDAAIS